MKSATTKIATLVVVFGLTCQGWTQQPLRHASGRDAAVENAVASGVRDRAGKSQAVHTGIFEFRWIEPQQRKNKVSQPPRIIRLVQSSDESDDLSDLLDGLADDEPKERRNDTGSVVDLLDDIADDQEDSTSTKEIDELLDQAKELIQGDDDSESLFGDDASDVEGDADELRRRLREQLENFLPDETTPEAPETHSHTSQVDEPDVYVDLVDPLPQPVYVPRRTATNQPYTLAGILTDNDQENSYREQEFCNRMWECAGGRHRSQFCRMRKEFMRNRNIIYRGGRPNRLAGLVGLRLGGGGGMVGMPTGDMSRPNGRNQGAVGAYPDSGGARQATDGLPMNDAPVPVLPSEPGDFLPTP